MALEMGPERFRRVEELFLGALALEPASRQAYLNRECGQDAELRYEVESLLAHRTQATDFLEPAERNVTETLLTGGQFGSYRILSPLGAGGMGEVYRAHDSKLGRDVAIKTLPRVLAHDPERLTRLRWEARTLASLNHPNIAAIYGLEETQSATCLVLELVEGEILHGPLPIPKVLDYARQIAEGLEAAHENGIVHRDLKPANVKVTPQGRVKILDFGLAKAVWGSNDAADLSQLSAPVGPETVAGHVVGSPPYMSPEQARGGDVDTRTDIWAFGCVLYELLTGKRAFRGDTLETTIQAILEREPDWSALPTKTPPSTATILKQCLQKDPKFRLQVIKDARTAIERVQKGRNHWRFAAVAATSVALIVTGAALWLRGPAPPATRDQWVQLTNFQDSVTQPALSPDGRMLAFVRGPSSYYNPGQIWIKILPNGEPKQLTHDDYVKLRPVFSPDGSRIAYTAPTPQQIPGTWTVPVLGGEPRLWLANTFGLAWKDAATIMFSEFLAGSHMAIQVAQESRAFERPVYVPEREDGSALLSYSSPDGNWALITERRGGPWLPCRLVPMNASSQGKLVGPQGSPCTFAAWSPDGRWMYFSSSAGGGFHAWRQRFPDGVPEQITSGPAEEEGIAVAPDGRWFVTAVGQRQRSVSIHSPSGDRQISLEGYAYTPKFTPDFKTVFYRVLKGSQPSSDPTELWIADLNSGRNELFLPGFTLAGAQPYDVSPDGTIVVFSARNQGGSAQLWVTPIDRHSPPQPIPNCEGEWPLFGPKGEIYFRGADGFAYRIWPDGSERRKVIDQPIEYPRGVSPDGEWLAVVATEPATKRADFVFPLKGGSPIRIWEKDSLLRWSPDGKFLFLQGSTASGGAGAFGRNYAFPLASGKMLPDIPPGGFRTEAEVAKYPGVRVIEVADIAPGPTPDVYAFSKETTQRNLFRIPLR